MQKPEVTIRLNAEAINRLKARINETVRQREHSAAKRRQWVEACAEFHQSYPNLFFPGGVAAWSSFLAREPGAHERAIEFLEADPWFFRSGYLKQIIWARLKRCLLSPTDLQRLEAIALSYLGKRSYAEFWYMVRFVRACGSTDFWTAVEQLATNDQTDRGAKAGWLLLARMNYPVRNWLGREFLRARYQAGYEPNIRLFKAANAA